MSLSKSVNITRIMEGQRQREFSLRERPHMHAMTCSSRYSVLEIPKYEFPEKSADAQAVYQMIHDELWLNGNSAQNMATFITNWMEPQVEKLIMENIEKNLADLDEYPQTGEIQTRCLSMLGNLFHATDDTNVMGTSTTGSSEAIMLCALSHKFNWRKQRQERGLSIEKPNMVMGTYVHVCFEKFCKYFDVEPRMIPVSAESRYIMDPKEILKYVDENTICVVGVLGTTYTGECDDIRGIAEVLDKFQKDFGFDIPIHVDAASGGFIYPFAYPDLEWDFRINRVKTINVSGHKYGLVYPGIGWAVWRHPNNLPKELIFHITYLGSDQLTFGLNFSRPSYQVIAQYYNFLRLGREGFTRIINNCLHVAKFMSMCLQESGYFILRSNVHKEGSHVIPVVSFSLKNTNSGYNEFDVMTAVKQKGWVVPAYRLPPNCQDQVILRVVIRENHSEDFIESLVKALVEVVEMLEQKQEKTTKGKNERIQEIKPKKLEGDLAELLDQGKLPKLEQTEGKSRHPTFNAVC